MDGFNPYDTLAVGYVVSPHLIECEDLPIAIMTLPDDGVQDAIAHEELPSTKEYLILSKDLESEFEAKYCYLAKDGFVDDLMTRLLR